MGCRASVEAARQRVGEDRDGDGILGQKSEGDGPGPPQNVSFLLFLFPLFFLITFLLSGGYGSRRQGCPSITQSSWGQEMVMYMGL